MLTVALSVESTLMVAVFIGGSARGLNQAQAVPGGYQSVILSRLEQACEPKPCKEILRPEISASR
ncbi:hypothetical protein KAM429_42230 [Aquipseudomonas alcaligenes]|uniref:Uncharacterized protein n=1 Tax=Aquipseudomonas alcaligenes TaxID=43263 RepID=A0AA37CJM6_AQUAC|nr:hypothetical protein KAM426_37010 [Pseudomonas alcaligenes]GIZ69081.1 hypothetical protein KAM428_41660 [Pseudomonas alcaligenes]GIZ73462.1 hypothetical protein KAM429_42230 [Pseudomonas alcaligenes]GIZ77825.1 hypothetical protein KAM430_42340 [Pseudomonas alcaligenes]GIZ82168.1 hypothetical protein KAM432_42160 [Pseudomonas alcaligenes]